MTVLAHSGHWLTQVAYPVPLLVLAAMLVSGRLRDRRTREQDSQSTTEDSGRPRIEVLYFAGCPGHERLQPTVEGLAKDAHAELVLRSVDTPEQAVAERFLGSPTVRVDGADVEPGADARTDFGLRRLYRFDGAQSTAPSTEWIGTALARANQDRRPR